MVKILIAENVPALNKGELALLKGMMESFNSLGEVKVKIMSSSPENDRIRYGGFHLLILFFRLVICLY